MNRRHTKRTRPTAFVAAAAVAALAMLALAGPASAHHHGEDHHGRHHHHRGHHKHRFDADRGPAGTIASYDKNSGRLVINLDGGDTVAGLVTEDTRIELGGHGCDHHGWWGDGRARRPLHGWEDHHWGPDASTDDLVPGAKVDSAILIVADGKATFLKVELSEPEPEPQAHSS